MHRPGIWHFLLSILFVFPSSSSSESWRQTKSAFRLSVYLVAHHPWFITAPHLKTLKRHKFLFSVGRLCPTYGVWSIPITFCIFSPGKCSNHGQFCIYWFMFNRCWCRHAEHSIRIFPFTVMWIFNRQYQTRNFNLKFYFFIDSLLHRSSIVIFFIFVSH